MNAPYRLKDLKDLYPVYFVNQKKSLYHPIDFAPLVNSFDYQVILYHEDFDLKSSRFLVFEDGLYGLLIIKEMEYSLFKAILVTGNSEQFDHLRNQIHEKIIWLSKDKMQEHIKHKYSEIKKLNHKEMDFFYEDAYSYFYLPI